LKERERGELDDYFLILLMMRLIDIGEGEETAALQKKKGVNLDTQGKKQYWLVSLSVTSYVGCQDFNVSDKQES